MFLIVSWWKLTENCFGVKVIEIDDEEWRYDLVPNLFNDYG